MTWQEGAIPIFQIRKLRLRRCYLPKVTQQDKALEASSIDFCLRTQFLTSDVLSMRFSKLSPLLHLIFCIAKLSRILIPTLHRCYGDKLVKKCRDRVGGQGRLLRWQHCRDLGA